MNQVMMAQLPLVVQGVPMANAGCYLLLRPDSESRRYAKKVTPAEAITATTTRAVSTVLGIRV